MKHYPTLIIKKHFFKIDNIYKYLLIRMIIPIMTYSHGFVFVKRNSIITIIMSKNRLIFCYCYIWILSVLKHRLDWENHVRLLSIYNLLTRMRYDTQVRKGWTNYIKLHLGTFEIQQWIYFYKSIFIKWHTDKGYSWPVRVSGNYCDILQQKS